MMAQHIEKERKKTFIFDWEIENFNFNTIEVGRSLKSPIFETEELRATSWYLKFYPKGFYNSMGFSSCFLSRTQAGVEQICIAFAFELIRSDGMIISYRKVEKRVFLKGNSFGLVKYFNSINDLNLNRITIRCTMILNESLDSSEFVSKCKAVTKIGINRYSFLWNVKMFDDYSWRKKRIFPCSQNKIKLILTAPMNSLNVRLGSMKNESHFIECKLSLLDNRKIEKYSGKYSHFHTSVNVADTWDIPSFITKETLINENAKFINEGFFTLKFEFSISNGNMCEEIEPVIIDYSSEVRNEVVKVNSILQENLQRMDIRNLQTDINPGNDSNVQEDTVSALQEDLKRMLTNKLHTDVNIRTKSHAFPAHKSLLSARSPVFTAMFEQDMLESSTGIVDIPDVEDNILDCFLKFVYTGIMESLDYDCASKLLIVADKYQVRTLKDVCSSFLMSNLTTENATDIAMLADMIGIETLKTHAIDYITNHAEIILPSDHWTRCVQANIKLTTDILFKLSVKYSKKKTGE